MDFEISARAEDYLGASACPSMDKPTSYGRRAGLRRPSGEYWPKAGNVHGVPPVVEELKGGGPASAGLWNLFLAGRRGAAARPVGPRLRPAGRGEPGPLRGWNWPPGGRLNCAAAGHPATWRCCTCSARPAQKERWLAPLLRGEIRSGLSRWTEGPRWPARDASNIRTRIERDGDEYRGHRAASWWTNRGRWTRAAGS